MSYNFYCEAKKSALSYKKINKNISVQLLAGSLTPGNPQLSAYPVETHKTRYKCTTPKNNTKLIAFNFSIYYFTNPSRVCVISVSRSLVENNKNSFADLFTFHTCRVSLWLSLSHLHYFNTFQCHLMPRNKLLQLPVASYCPSEVRCSSSNVPLVLFRFYQF